MQKIKLEPNDFELQTTSVWDFPDRGKWATHDASYRGNWSPYIPRNIILRYSNEQELILDQFAGGVILRSKKEEMYILKLAMQEIYHLFRMKVLI